MENMYCCFRLTGRGQKTYMINVDTARIAYKANDSNVKIYLEADSGVHKSSHEFDRVSSIRCRPFLPLCLYAALSVAEIVSVLIV